MKTSIPKLHSIKWKNGQLAEDVHTINFGQDTPVINVLQGAAEEMLKAVCVIGYDSNNQEYIACSYSNPKEAAYLFGRGQLFMIRQAD